MGVLPLQHLRVGGLQTAGEAAHHRRAHNYLTDGVRRGTVTTACLLPAQVCSLHTHAQPLACWSTPAHDRAASAPETSLQSD